MRPLARLRDELQVSAIANMVVGDVVLIAAAFRTEHPGRAVVWFILVSVVMVGLWGTVAGSGRLRGQVRAAPVADPAAVIEPRAGTRRRVLVGLAPVAIVLVILVVVAPESAAVLAGVPSGIGAADLWTAAWIRNVEHRRADVALRDVPESPFAGGARRVYTRPMNEATDAT